MKLGRPKKKKQQPLTLDELKNRGSVGIGTMVRYICFRPRIGGGQVTRIIDSSIKDVTNWPNITTSDEDILHVEEVIRWDGMHLKHLLKAYIE